MGSAAEEGGGERQRGVFVLSGRSSPAQNECRAEASIGFCISCEGKCEND